MSPVHILREGAAVADPLAPEPVTGHTSGPFEPLRASQAGHIVPGHRPWERHDPPTERAAR